MCPACSLMLSQTCAPHHRGRVRWSLAWGQCTGHAQVMHIRLGDEQSPGDLGVEYPTQGWLVTQEPVEAGQAKLAEPCFLRGLAS